MQHEHTLPRAHRSQSGEAWSRCLCLLWSSNTMGIGARTQQNGIHLMRGMMSLQTHSVPTLLQYRTSKLPATTEFWYMKFTL